MRTSLDSFRIPKDMLADESSRRRVGKRVPVPLQDGTEGYRRFSCAQAWRRASCGTPHSGDPQQLYGVSFPFMVRNEARRVPPLPPLWELRSFISGNLHEERLAEEGEGGLEFFTFMEEVLGSDWDMPQVGRDTSSHAPANGASDANAQIGEILSRLDETNQRQRLQAAALKRCLRLLADQQRQIKELKEKTTNKNDMCNSNTPSNITRISAQPTEATPTQENDPNPQTSNDSRGAPSSEVLQESPLFQSRPASPVVLLPKSDAGQSFAPLVHSNDDTQRSHALTVPPSPSPQASIGRRRRPDEAPLFRTPGARPTEVGPATEVPLMGGGGVDSLPSAWLGAPDLTLTADDASLRETAKEKEALQERGSGSGEKGEEAAVDAEEEGGANMLSEDRKEMEKSASDVANESDNGCVQREQNEERRESDTEDALSAVLTTQRSDADGEAEENKEADETIEGSRDPSKIDAESLGEENEKKEKPNEGPVPQAEMDEGNETARADGEKEVAEGDPSPAPLVFMVTGEGLLPSFGPPDAEAEAGEGKGEVQEGEGRDDSDDEKVQSPEREGEREREEKDSLQSQTASIASVGEQRREDLSDHSNGSSSSSGSGLPRSPQSKEAKKAAAVLTSGAIEMILGDPSLAVSGFCIGEESLHEEPATQADAPVDSHEQGRRGKVHTVHVPVHASEEAEAVPSTHNNKDAAHQTARPISIARAQTAALESFAFNQLLQSSAAPIMEPDRRPPTDDETDLSAAAAVAAIVSETLDGSLKEASQTTQSFVTGLLDMAQVQREGKGREGKGREEEGREGKGREGNQKKGNERESGEARAKESTHQAQAEKRAAAMEARVARLGLCVSALWKWQGLFHEAKVQDEEEQEAQMAAFNEGQLEAEAEAERAQEEANTLEGGPACFSLSYSLCSAR
eukprot:Cvel_9120.t1-p1 / transcript=Cvel_9120.t1 / gene=Cvel_9120 / organism=Chromera_velia_CCMP2878 / gene_product=hypothetical protein / transcript_product=hypothetical protein / location=Cvel_scaffold518:39600-43305(-) / protein_length=916 / sequence_SO=supercontig / SO=protein_coding / is_pseudo=false